MIVYIEDVEPNTKILDADFPHAKWNTGTFPFTRNCYTFVCNAEEPASFNLAPGKYDISLPRPGDRGGSPFAKPTFLHPNKSVRAAFATASLRKALVSDGFVVLPYKNQKDVVPMEGHYLVAAYISPDLWDYHFYRRHEETGLWYHKAGSMPVIDRDRSGNRIIDPQQADRGQYTMFAGFLFVPKMGIPLNIQIIPADHSPPVKPPQRPNTHRDIFHSPR